MAVDEREAEKKVESVTLNGTEHPALADGEYDAIIMGTGLKTCILAGLLAKKGLRVMILDRNDYYGGESASLNLSNMYRKFIKDEDPPAEFVASLKGHRDWNVDLIPKFIMANGKLVKILVHTGVTRYLEFKQIDGSFVYKSSNDSVSKVPATEMEALSTGLMGFFQKRKFRNFLQWVAKVNPDDPSTFDSLNPRTTTMSAVYAKFDLDGNSQDFAGHAMGLQHDDSYLEQPALPTVDKLKLYAESLARYGKSPYIYPMWGLGGLPEGFSRLCAVHGGTFMLHAKDPEIVLEDGKFVGVVATTPMGAREAAKAPMIIGDPSYFGEKKSRRTGHVIRSICILNHPVARIGGIPSAQIIIPQKQIGRKHDIYVTVVGQGHGVAQEGMYIAIVSTTVETSNPAKEVEPGIALLGDVMYRFDNINESLEPTDDGTADGQYVFSTYDASSHFEATAEDVLAMYARVTGEPLDMAISTEIPTE